MTRLLLIRHGLSITNKARMFTGQMNVSLAPLGYEQASKTAEYVAAQYKVDVIYASDLDRACQTVQPLAERLGLPIHTCRDLREIDVGSWQARLVEEIGREFPAEYAHYVNDPGTFHFERGESFSALMERAMLALTRIAKENDGKTVVIGTHGGVIRSLLAAWSGFGIKRIKEIPSVANCSITVVECESGEMRPVQIAFAGHLADLDSKDKR